MPVAGLPVKADCRAAEHSPLTQQRSWNCTSTAPRRPASPALICRPESATCTSLPLHASRGGLHRGEVRLVGDDGSKFDDRRFFTMEVDQGIPVAVVKPQRHEIPYLDDTYYLEQASAPAQRGSGALQPRLLMADDLVGEPLDEYKVIFCVNLPAPDDATAERLGALRGQRRQPGLDLRRQRSTRRPTTR